MQVRERGGTEPASDAHQLYECLLSAGAQLQKPIQRPLGRRRHRLVDLTVVAETNNHPCDGVRLTLRRQTRIDALAGFPPIHTTLEQYNRFPNTILVHAAISISLCGAGDLGGCWRGRGCGGVLCGLVLQLMESLISDHDCKDG